MGEYWIYKKTDRDFYLAKKRPDSSLLEIKNPWNDLDDIWYNEIRPWNFESLCPLGPFESAQDARNVICDFEEELIENYGILEGIPRDSMCQKLEKATIEPEYMNKAMEFLDTLIQKKEKWHLYLTFEMPSHIHNHYHVDFYRFEISPCGRFAGREQFHQQYVPKALAIALKYRGGLTIKKISALGPLVTLQNGQSIKIHQKIVYGMYLGQSHFSYLDQNEIKLAYSVDSHTGAHVQVPRCYSFRHAQEMMQQKTQEFTRTMLYPIH